LASRVHDKILIATGTAKAICSVVGESARRSVINSMAPVMAAPQQAKDGYNLAGSFSLHSPINVNLGQQDLVFRCERNSQT
jgi:hypothetical protein